MKGDAHYFQCQICGEIHQVDDKYKPKEGEIYSSLWCNRCGKTVLQLYCGTDENDIYILYNLNVDSRYY